MKILISGVSGIGKTTLAKYISEEYKIPFIVGSSKVLWPKYHIESHRMLIDRCNASNQFALDFQYELLEYRKTEMAKYPWFVTDRSPLDNIVYFLLQMSHNVSQYETAKYIEECNKSLPLNTLSLYLSFNEGILKEMDHLENDGARVTNNYYQLMVAAIFNMVKNRYIEDDVNSIIHWDMDKRKQMVNQLIIEKYGGRANPTNMLF